MPKKSEKEIKISALQMMMGGDANNLDSLTNDLQLLGFGDHEAKAYLALLSSGPATAYEVAKVAGLPRANAYTVLKNLNQKGAAQLVSDKPMRYMPVKPSELLSTISESAQNLCTSLSDRLEKLAPENDQDYVWVFRGKMNMIRKITEMIKGAEHHLWLKGTDQSLSPFIPELTRALKRGINIVLVLFSENPSKFELGPNCKVYMHEGNGVILGNAHKFLTITADSERAIITTTGHDPEASYSENANFIYMVDIMLKHEIFLAEIMERFGDQVERELGPGLLSLRQVYSPKQMRGEFQDYLNRRTKELKQH